jgi:hypothetical protein
MGVFWVLVLFLFIGEGCLREILPSALLTGEEGLSIDKAEKKCCDIYAGSGKRNEWGDGPESGQGGIIELAVVRGSFGRQTMAGWGQCMRKHKDLGGETDGCQAFEPAEENPKLCEVCECKQGWHQKPAEAVAQAHDVAPNPKPSASSAGVQGAGECGGTNPEAKTAAAAEESCELVEKPAKKAKTSDGGESGQQIDDEVPTKPGVEDHSCPAVTRNSMANLLKSHPAEEYGVFELRLNKSSGKWEIWCEP